MTAAEFDRLSERLRSRLEGDARVLALVALGSTALPERRDAYSDHDFWVVVTPGAKFDHLDRVVAADLLAAARLPAVEAAIRLLDITDRELRDVLPDYPAHAAKIVRSALDRLSPNAGAAG